MPSMYKLQWEPLSKLQFRIVLCNISWCLSLVSMTHFPSFGSALCFSLRKYFLLSLFCFILQNIEQGLSGYWKRGWAVLQRGVLVCGLWRRWWLGFGLRGNLFKLHNQVSESNDNPTLLFAITFMLLHSEIQSSRGFWSCYDFSSQVIWIADLSTTNQEMYWKEIL